MDISKVIKELRIRKDLTLEQVGDYVGVSKATVLKWESGQIKNMRRDKIVKLAEILGTTPGDLLGWSLQDTEKKTSNDLDSIPGLMPIVRKSFPLLGEIACGEPTWQPEAHETMVESVETLDADFCLRATGDSMKGSQIDDGDIVFIKQMPMVDNGDIAAVLIENETTLKRVDYNPESGQLILWPDNPAYRPLIYQGEELNGIRILGRAVMVQKVLRKK